MKTAGRAIYGAAIAILVMVGVGHAQLTSAICPPTAPNSGIVTIVGPIIPGFGNQACDYGFTVNTTAILVQVGPNLGRNHVKLTNRGAAGTASVGVCLGALKANVACTFATAGTILEPGQTYEQWSSTVNNGSGTQLVNTLWMNADIEVIGSTSGGTVAVTIE